MSLYFQRLAVAKFVPAADAHGGPLLVNRSFSELVVKLAAFPEFRICWTQADCVRQREEVILIISGSA